MRLWSLHPKYLDSKGLVALWREALLAQHVLTGRTKGYKNHPQLVRFKNHPNPAGAIGSYLWEVYLEASRRGYHFQNQKILKRLKKNQKVMPVPRGQVAYEFLHLKKKLKKRDSEQFSLIKEQKRVLLHPLFFTVRGPAADWERTSIEE